MRQLYVVLLLCFKSTITGKALFIYLFSTYKLVYYLILFTTPRPHTRFSLIKADHQVNLVLFLSIKSHKYRLNRINSAINVNHRSIVRLLYH